MSKLALLKDSMVRVKPIPDAEGVNPKTEMPSYIKQIIYSNLRFGVSRCKSDSSVGPRKGNDSSEILVPHLEVGRQRVGWRPSKNPNHQYKR